MTFAYLMVALAVALVVLASLRVDRRNVADKSAETRKELQPSGRWPNGSYL